MQEFCARIGVEIVPNRDFRVFHFKTRLLRTDQWISDISNNDIDSASPAMWAMNNELKAVEGIKKVSIWPYEVFIEKAPMYSWKEIEPSIKRIFAWRFPSKPA